jgi:hypothetical protein
MKISSLIVCALALLTFASCKKDKTETTPYSCATCVRQPDALAANDASSKGIYKGIVIGSSGTIMFDIANNGTSITALMVIDGTTVNLASSVSWVAGQPYISPFTGTLNGSPVSITFSVDINGQDPTVTASSIPGHPNAVFTVVKELSNALVECFEGNYSTSEPATGTFNIMLSRSLGLWSGTARETGSTSTDDVDGTIVNNKLIDSSNGVEVGTLNLDVITGTFTDSNGSTVTINGQRTL